MEERSVVEMKRRGRKPKNQKKEINLNQEQTKFFVDLSHEKDSLDLIFGLLRKCNEKDYGRAILFKDLCLYAMAKLTDKDIEKIQEMSLGEMEKVQRLLDEHNKKTGLNLTLGEFLIKKLGIN
jgi:DNA-binding FadR family transcriptional regulator